MSNYIKKILSNYIIQSILFLVLAVVITISLSTYSASDPSFNLSTDKYPNNDLGYLGSYIADFSYQIFGYSSFIFPLYFFYFSISLFKRGYVPLMIPKIISMLLIALSVAALLAQFDFKVSFINSGGVLGSMIYQLFGQDSFITSIVCIIIISTIILLTMGVNYSDYQAILQKLTSLLNFKLPSFNISLPQKAANQLPITTHRDIAIALQPIAASPVATRPSQENQDFKVNILAKSQKQISSQSYTQLTSQISASLPPVDLLKLPSDQNIKTETIAELKSNTEDLINVLEDFGVKGQIIDVSQGPVVTLYELEPAPGTKSSRIVGLSDDIARSLSALSTRIAVVAGRNALGIELPNKQRAFFCLRELIETPQYQDPSIILPLILGKDIAGKPYVADLAKMPHLLVAGTTGSGKSVAINTMIMSLLYRYTPAECRLIMIDPKMLELSVYDNIPHLLTPVVTEPSKAVIALKWAVKEMENRYRAMSNVGVRNIAGYNAKVTQSIKEGKALERTVQTGFDTETGKPIFESVAINTQALPFIVVIVDEMADLMLVAGKDIESLIQRLAQMARAAGIHIIMATQRPSVDVITGVIKANFPTRISFKVTSKIDSRTIFGEPGAEQLLGMGDMLYMGNSSKIVRVHGPFVADSEVEHVTDYLRSTGMPDYVSAVTEVAEEDAISEDSENGDDDESIYKKAKQIVKLERKVSISYIQRCLRIGYNRAANIVERMERENIVSAPNHTGKREILLPEE